MERYISKIAIVVLNFTLFILLFTTSFFEIGVKYEYYDSNNKIQVSDDCYQKRFSGGMFCTDSNEFIVEVSSYRTVLSKKKSFLDILIRNY